ncbi:unnamed protein product [Ostreobium quekettii]|uniref:Uncharacterized protein n=1 Tax=Ostreobium quekettii TaxID=121088 RepID=A0A8S1JG10_9CHLO|nr:unnamed protein product [Ostreobium quekettii]|eukprot:evm.model.scf_23.8 EVM.evm.TU.scf_23.8   scf_23:65015-74621(+)
MGAARVDVHEELRKLKQIAEHTEEWASKVTSFLVVTQDLCKSAAHILCHLDDDARGIENVLVSGAETVAETVAQVVELARTRSTEVVKQYQKRSQGVNHRELQSKVEQASLSVGLAIFETLQLQAEQFRKLSEKSIGAARKRASSLASRLPSLPVSESGFPHALMPTHNGKGKLFDDGQSEATGTGTGTDDVELDWDAFDSDLKVMTDTASPEEIFRTARSLDMPSGPEPHGPLHMASAEFRALWLRIDELDGCRSGASFKASHAERRAEEALEKAREVQAVADQALLRAQRAEEALRRLQREREEWENMHPCHTDDDYNEVRRALKEEQMARLRAEEGMKAAEAEAKRYREEAQAAHEAHEMTQMAARLADEQLSARGGGVERFDLPKGGLCIEQMGGSGGSGVKSVDRSVGGLDKSMDGSRQLSGRGISGVKGVDRSVVAGGKVVHGNRLRGSESAGAKSLDGSSGVLDKSTVGNGRQGGRRLSDAKSVDRSVCEVEESKIGSVGYKEEGWVTFWEGEGDVDGPQGGGRVTNDSDGQNGGERLGGGMLRKEEGIMGNQKIGQSKREDGVHEDKRLMRENKIQPGIGGGKAQRDRSDQEAGHATAQSRQSSSGGALEGIDQGLRPGGSVEAVSGSQGTGGDKRTPFEMGQGPGDGDPFQALVARSSSGAAVASNPFGPQVATPGDNPFGMCEPSPRGPLRPDGPESLRPNDSRALGPTPDVPQRPGGFFDEVTPTPRRAPPALPEGGAGASGGWNPFAVQKQVDDHLGAVGDGVAGGVVGDETAWNPFG